MGVQVLEHVTIRCAQLGRTRDFYVELMGLSEGERPAFLLPRPLALSGRGPGHPSCRGVRQCRGLGGRIVMPKAEDGTGSFDHVAFRGDDFQAMRARLQEAGVTFKERIVPGGQLSQLFVPDPEGVLVEINFRN